MFGVGALGLGCPPGVVGAEVAGAPQMPAELLALAILARSGPLLEAEPLLIPAPVDAVDQRELNASAPPPGFDPAVGLPRVAADVEDPYDGCCTEDGMFGLFEMGAEPDAWLWTEVK